jgi:hypothetical protein
LTRRRKTNESDRRCVQTIGRFFECTKETRERAGREKAAKIAGFGGKAAA